MTNDRVEIVVDGPSAVVDDFVPLDSELLSVRRQQDADLLPAEDLQKVENQCRAWSDAAVVAFREWAASAGPEWQLSEETCVPGTYRHADGGGCMPCVQVTGVLSRGTEEEEVAIWYTADCCYREGFPTANITSG